MESANIGTKTSGAKFLFRVGTGNRFSTCCLECENLQMQINCFKDSKAHENKSSL